MRNITDLGSFAVKNDGSEDFKKFVLEPLNEIAHKYGESFAGTETWYYGLKELDPFYRSLTDKLPDVPILSVQQVKDYLLSGVRPGEEKTEERITMPTDSQIDAVIKEQIAKMWGGLEMASIEYFIQTGTVNGAFYERISNAIRDTFHLVRIKQRTESLKQKS